MSADDTNGDEHLELVMPFVVCISQGGPYEDQAFVAGYSAGVLDEKLSRRTIVTGTDTYRAALAPQIDLIAMRYDYRVELLDGPEDGWVHLKFTRVDGEVVFQ